MSGQGFEVFAKTCQKYFMEICRTDFLARAEILGVQVEKRALVIPLYDQVFLFLCLSAHSGTPQFQRSR